MGTVWMASDSNGSPVRSTESTPSRGRGEGRPALPLAERRRRRREIGLSSLLIVVIVGIVVAQQWVSTPRDALSLGGGALFLFLNALNVFLIILLIYLVARNLVKLVFERRRGTLGSHLNLKIVAAFALVAVVPTAVLFLVSSSIVGSSINTWFSLQIDRTLDESRQVADFYYQSAEDNALLFGSRIAEQITERRLFREDNLEQLTAFIQEKQRPATQSSGARCIIILANR